MPFSSNLASAFWRENSNVVKMAKESLTFEKNLPVNPRWVGLRTAGCLEVEVIIMTFDKVLKKRFKKIFLTNQFHEFRLGCV